MMPRTRKVMVAVLVVAAASGVILWNTAAQEGPTMLGVGDAKRQASDLDGRSLQVRGFVEEGSIVYNGTVVESFVLGDEHEKMLVRYGQTPPDAFGPKDVVVEGELTTLDDGTVVLDASAVKVGCSSKY